MVTPTPIGEDSQEAENLRTASPATDRFHVDRFTDGILDPERPMLGPVKDGGEIAAETAPGCWGPMITPCLRGGHEVTQPVAVEGAEVGDAIAIRIKEIEITSLATSSGTDESMEGRFLGDPYVSRKCPECGTTSPQTVIRGIGEEAIRCVECGADATPFHISNGYTIAFDKGHSIGVTLSEEGAEEVARDAGRNAAIPKNSVQNPVLTFAPHDLVGIATRLRPFLGQLGTTPSIAMPDSHNAGDFGSFLIDSPHDFGITAAQLEGRTDGHMDIDAVRAGAILICPVKTPGGGVYLGDMHALQGDGEIAGHTCDVAGKVRLQVHVLKGLGIEGPILFPLLEDLPFLARPLSREEHSKALELAKASGLEAIEETAPVSIVGTGPNLNAATETGLKRAADLLDMTVPEVMNRATITGAIEIGRHPGVIQVTFRAPVDRLEKRGLLPFAAG